MKPTSLWLVAQVIDLVTFQSGAASDCVELEH